MTARVKSLFSPAPPDAPAAVNIERSTTGRDLCVQTQTAQTITNNYGDASADAAAQLEQEYVEKVFEKMRYADLSGVDSKVSEYELAKCVERDAIYTPLLTEQYTSAEDSRERRRYALDLLNAERRLVLLGEPGSGKSMFVNVVAQCLAGERLGKKCANLARLREPLSKEKNDNPELPISWAHGALLPVIFILRDVSASAAPNAPGNAALLLDFLNKKLADWHIPEYAPHLQKRLRTPGVLVLFDGLDEVAEAEQRQRQIIQAVEDFATLYASCRILVTCRKYAYDQRKWRLSGVPFTVAVLSLFIERQMRDFIPRWYQHRASLPGANLPDWKGRAARLEYAILHKPQLFDLARRPLLLTLMASLHAWRRGELPEQRAKLYEEITELLLDRWVEDKIIYGPNRQPIVQQGLPGIEKIDKAALKTALSQLACDSHAKQPSAQDEAETLTADISQDELKRALSSLCYQHGLNELKVAEHLKDRVGILAERGGVYAFPHRTFQEYLAACYLVNAQDQDYPANLVAFITQDVTRWQEVLLLAASVGKNKVWELADELCPKTMKEKQADGGVMRLDAQTAILAAQALKEAGIDFTKPLSEAKEQKKERIRAWLKAILTEQTPKGAPLSALERAQAGDLLAAFGDNRDGVGLKDHLPNIEWVEIPEGEFWMGSDTTVDPNAEDDEQPRHRVHVSTFWMSRYPVTNAQYQAFVEDGGYKKASYWEAGGGWKEKEEDGWTGPRHFDDPRFALANHPVVGVSWYEAMAFCAWLTSKKPSFFEKLGFSGVVRLPTEAEWEYAARGPGDAYRRYPWGNDDITPDRANYAETNIGATSAVGAFPRGRAAWMGDGGVEDLAGNVWEWCADVWHGNYKNAPDDGSAWVTDGDPERRVLRGGAYYNDVNNLRCAVRLRYNWQVRRDCDWGFRLVCSRRVPVSPF